MPTPYSDDLRYRVIDKLSRGWTQKKAAENFNLGLVTVERWWRRYKKEGHYKPISGYQNGHSHKIKDLDSFKELIINNHSLTCNEIALRLGNISKSTAHNYLKKINFSRKKKLSLRRT